VFFLYPSTNIDFSCSLPTLYHHTKAL